MIGLLRGKILGKQPPRLLLDVHSGRIFGRAGVLWVDVVGVLLGTLATSGTLMWLLHRRRYRGG